MLQGRKVLNPAWEMTRIELYKFTKCLFAQAWLAKLKV